MRVRSHASSGCAGGAQNITSRTRTVHSREDVTREKKPLERRSHSAHPTLSWNEFIFGIKGANTEWERRRYSWRECQVVGRPCCLSLGYFPTLFFSSSHMLVVMVVAGGAAAIGSQRPDAFRARQDLIGMFVSKGPDVVEWYGFGHGFGLLKAQLVCHSSKTHPSP